MDIDLTAGLLKPKIALTELPIGVVPDQPKGALPDFSALLSGATPDEPPVPAGPAIDVPMQLSVALSETPTQDTAPIEEAETVQAEVKKTAENPEVPTENAALYAPNLPVVPLEIKANRTAPPLPSHAAEASVNNRIAAPATAEQTAKAAEFAPVLRQQADTQATVAPRQKYDIPAESPPMAAAPKTQPDTKAPTALFAPLPVDNPANAHRIVASAEPRTDTKLLSAKTPLKSSPQAAALPAPALSFSNVETVVDAPDELQFGIKIERQTVEINNPSRVAPQATRPVASQIAAQLPQMLTKAEKQTVELRLDPPELGRVTIHLTTNDQQVTATVVAERVDTVDLMRRHAELLTATLARAGFSQADLSFQQGQGQNGKAEFEQFQSITELIESSEPTVSAPTSTGQDGRLDIRL